MYLFPSDVIRIHITKYLLDLRLLKELGESFGEGARGQDEDSN